MINKTHRKGQVGLGQTPSLVVLLIVIAIALFLGVTVVDQIQDGQKSTSTQNDTLTIVSNSAGIALSREYGQSATFGVTNFSNGAVALSSSWTTAGLDTSTPTITITNASFAGPTEKVYVDYTYDVQDGLFNVTKGGVSGLGSLGDFQSLFGLVIAAAIILGLVSMIGFKSAN
jgi:hypothetical protein